MAKQTFGDLSSQFQQFEANGLAASSSRLNQNTSFGGYQLGNDNGFSRQFGQEYQLQQGQAGAFPELNSRVNPAFGNLAGQINSHIPGTSQRFNSLDPQTQAYLTTLPLERADQFIREYYSTNQGPVVSIPVGAANYSQVSIPDLEFESLWPGVNPNIPVLVRNGRHHTVVSPRQSAGSGLNQEWAQEYNRANSRISPSLETRLAPDWAQEYNAPVLQPQSTTSLNSLLNPFELAITQNYFDPQVQALILSGQAATAAELFLEQNPNITKLGPGLLKLLKYLVLETLTSEEITQEPQLVQQIQQTANLTELYSLLRTLALPLTNFGQTIKVDLEEAWGRYLTQQGRSDSALEMKVFDYFRSYQDRSKAELKAIEDGFKKTSTAVWGHEEASKNDLARQVVDFFLNRFNRKMPWSWGKYNLADHLAATQPETAKLLAFSQDSQQSTEARYLAKRLLDAMPITSNQTSHIYADIIALAQALRTQPLKTVKRYMYDKGLLNYFNSDWLAEFNQGSQASQVLNSAEEFDPQEWFIPYQLQELQYYLNPKVQYLIQTGQAESIANDFINGRIVNQAGLPPGSLDLIKMLLYDYFLRNEFEQADLDSRLNAVAQARDVDSLQNMYGGMNYSESEFTKPLQIDMELAYRRYRFGQPVPGDGRLVKYFRKYIDDNGQPNTLTDEIDINDPSLDPIDRQMLHYLNEVYPSQRGELPSHNDYARNMLAGILNNTPPDPDTKLAAETLAKFLPQNSHSQVYNSLAELADRLRVGQIDAKTVLSFLKSQGASVPSQAATVTTPSVSLGVVLNDYSVNLLKLLTDPEVIAAINSHSAEELNQLVYYDPRVRYNFNLLNDISDLTKLKLIKLSLVNGLDTSIEYNRKYQKEIVSEIMAAKDLYTLSQLAQYYSKLGVKTFELDNSTLLQRLERLRANPTVTSLADQLSSLAKTKPIKAVVEILDRIITVLEQDPNQAGAVAKLLADKGINLIAVPSKSPVKVTVPSKPAVTPAVKPLPLAAPVQTNYADVLASRQFLVSYRDFLSSPNQTKAKFLLNKLNAMQNLVLPEALTVLPGYVDLNERLASVNKIYLSGNKTNL